MFLNECSIVGVQVDQNDDVLYIVLLTSTNVLVLVFVFLAYNIINVVTITIYSIIINI